MKLNLLLEWRNSERFKSRKYVCGYCNSDIASEYGYTAVSNEGPAFIYICHKCKRPTYFDPADNQVPGAISGNRVNEISEQKVLDLYEEARKITGSGAYTATILCCRKLLMHIAVSKGAEEGKRFAYYVDYLSTNNFVPPDAKGWVDHIRTKGNEANHEITIMQKEDAEELLMFIEMSLKIIYEFPAIVRKKYPHDSTK